jgi:hypothetical protein
LKPRISLRVAARRYPACLGELRGDVAVKDISYGTTTASGSVALPERRGNVLDHDQQLHPGGRKGLEPVSQVEAGCLVVGPLTRPPFRATRPQHAPGCGSLDPRRSRGRRLPLRASDRQAEHWEVVTRGAVQQITLAFFDEYCDEAWAFVSPDVPVSGFDQQGCSVEQSRADLRALAPDRPGGPWQGR